MARKLTRARIVDEALALLQEHGFEKVSVNEVARRLDVGVASLYWHVANKAELHRLMAGRIYDDCIADLPQDGGWQDWLLAFGLSLWRAQSSVRDSRLLIITVNVPEDTRRSYDDWIVDQLVDRGLSPKVARAAQHSVQALVTGWTTLQLEEGAESAVPPEFRQALEHVVIAWAR